MACNMLKASDGRPKEQIKFSKKKKKKQEERKDIRIQSIKETKTIIGVAIRWFYKIMAGQQAHPCKELLQEEVLLSFPLLSFSFSSPLLG
jgi:hypothetical protein